MIEFYLGTHQANWLSTFEIPLFVSDRRLRRYRTLPRARPSWALDSGAFTELSTYGSWDHGPTPKEYAARIDRYATEVGGLAWASPQDWMCEPPVRQRTGLGVRAHIERTVSSVVELRTLTTVPVIAVVQGWELADYATCVETYARAGIDLAREPVVGLGSVCRRERLDELGAVLAMLNDAGIHKIHGFGVKITGLHRYGAHLRSTDSLSWSYNARRNPRLEGCVHARCQNCPRYAQAWYRSHIAPLIVR